MDNILPFVLPKDKQPAHPQYGRFIKEMQLGFDMHGGNWCPASGSYGEPLKAQIYEHGFELDGILYKWKECVDITQTYPVLRAGRDIKNDIIQYIFRFDGEESMLLPRMVGIPATTTFINEFMNNINELCRRINGLNT